MIVIISIILTGLVMTIAWSAGVQAQIAGSTVHVDQANTAAESAAQWAVWKFKTDNTWRQSAAPSTFPTMAIGSDVFNYSVTCIDAGASATLYWPFNEGVGTTSADTSGHGNTGALIGGVTWVTGKYGEALSFDGSTGYVDAGNNSSTNITSSVTMSAWVKMNSAGNDQKVGGNQDGTAGGYKMSIFGLKCEFEVRDASNTPTLNRNVTGGTLLAMGNWFHVCGVYNTSTATIKTYINGVLDRELDNVPALALGSTTGHFIMGREPWNGSIGTTRYFNGCIDDVRVYNRALSDQEIKTLANNSVHIHSAATLKTTASNPPIGGVDFICSAPTPVPPIAPALAAGGNLQLNLATVSGNVQATGSVTGVGTSSVNGLLTYGTSLSDSHHYITVTNSGKTSSATQNSSATVPTINYASIQAQAPNTGTAGTGKTYSFTPYYNGTISIIYVNGNVTDPIVDTSACGGTLLVHGSITLTKNFTAGAAGYPAYIICDGSCTQSGGSTTIVGGLYVGGSWTHMDCNINGDVSVTGNIIDNTATASTYVVGGIPWFDPRASLPATPVPMFSTSFMGLNP